MPESKALVPVEQKTIDFYGDEIAAVLIDDGQVYVPIRPICDFLGVSWGSQRNRINRDLVLSQEVKGVFVMNTPGGRQEMLCLPLDYLNGWLFGINATRVSDQLRERLIRYQRECYRILARAFLDRSLPAETSPSMATLIQVREMGRAIMQMAEEQIEFDRRLSTTEGELERTTHIVGSLTTRMERLEQRVAPGEPVTEEQASQLSQAVKAVAMALGKQTKRNEYGGVYGELYRKYGITSYKLLPVAKFQEAMRWLGEWYSSITDEALPF